MTERTFFGLEVVNGRGVRMADIASLPFAAFWEESAVGSGQMQDFQSGEWLIHLHDWKEFSLLFIATGRHRHMPRPPHVHGCDQERNDSDHTYFGLKIWDQHFVRKDDIAHLPFYAFWLEGSGKVIASNEDDCVSLEIWRRFSKTFIETGQHHRKSANTLNGIIE